MAAENSKLRYFSLSARGEPARLLLHQAGVNFEDIHLSFQDWPQLKTDTRLFPLGNVPTLELADGTVLCMSQCIFRFIAHAHHLAGETFKEMVSTDIISDVAYHLIFPQFPNVLFKPASEEKNEAIKKLIAGNHVPLKFLTAKLKENGGGKGFFVGTKITIADIMVMFAFDCMHHLDPEFSVEYPELRDLCDRVRQEASPTLKKYLEKRGPPKLPL